jgi:hypothetical protein
VILAKLIFSPVESANDLNSPLRRKSFVASALREKATCHQHTVQLKILKY